MSKVRVPWAQKSRQLIAHLEQERHLLQQQLKRAEERLEEARMQRQGWQELAERLLLRLSHQK